MNIRVIAMCVAAAALSISGCGDDDDEGPLRITFSQQSVSFLTQEYNTSPPPSQTITITASSGRIYVQVTGYPYAFGGCASERQCQLVIEPPPPGNPAAAGSYTYSANVRVCEDAACSQVIQTAAIPIGYTITPGVQLTSPTAIALTATQGMGTGPQVVPLTFVNGTPTTVTTAVTYAPGNNALWLTVTPSPTQLTVSTSALPPGTWNASIAVTYGTAAFTHTVSVPLSVTVAALANVYQIGPYVTTVNSSLAVTLSGVGFNSMTHPPRFNGIDAVSFVVVNDREIRAVPPPFATPGSYTVDIPNDVGVAAAASRLLVVPAQAYPSAEVDVSALAPGNGEQTPLHMVFDAERVTLYISGLTPTVQTVTWTGATWSVAPLASLGPINSDRVHLSPDGTHLFVTGSAQMFSDYDLARHRVGTIYNDPVYLPVGPIHPLIDGRVATRVGRNNKVIDLSRLTLTFFTGSLLPAEFATSADQRRILAHGIQVGYSMFSASDNAELPIVSPLPVLAADGAAVAALDRHGERIATRDAIYAADVTLLGRLTDPRLAATDDAMAFSPDGARLYVAATDIVAGSPVTTVGVYDATAPVGGFYARLFLLNLPTFAGLNPAVAVSADGNTVFVCGHDRLYVIPAP
ncbi:MAG TPA: hypothetical protein VFU13_12970 [Steroidobacteraceae bacterium]|nr:hypothetical protein [Steroidobacteraceae bacterium]